MLSKFNRIKQAKIKDFSSAALFKSILVSIIFLAVGISLPDNSHSSDLLNPIKWFLMVSGGYFALLLTVVLLFRGVVHSLKYTGLFSAIPEKLYKLRLCLETKFFNRAIQNGDYKKVMEDSINPLLLSIPASLIFYYSLGLPIYHWLYFGGKIETGFLKTFFEKVISGSDFGNWWLSPDSWVGMHYIVQKILSATFLNDYLIGGICFFIGPFYLGMTIYSFFYAEK